MRITPGIFGQIIAVLKSHILKRIGFFHWEIIVPKTPKGDPVNLQNAKDFLKMKGYHFFPKKKCFEKVTQCRESLRSFAELLRKHASILLVIRGYP